MMLLTFVVGARSCNATLMIRDCVVMNAITQAFSYANNFETVVTVACWYIRELEACLDGIMAFCCDSARRFSRSFGSLMI